MAGLFGLPLILAADSPSIPAGSDRVEYAYAGPLAIRGDTSGSCMAWGVNFFPHQPGRLSAEAAQGLLTVRETWVNATIVDGAPVQEQVRQTHWTREVAPGTVTLKWDESGLATVFPYQYHEPHRSYASFLIEFKTTELTATPKSWFHQTPSPFWTSYGIGAVVRLEGTNFPGDSRRITLGDDALATGNVSLYLHAAEILLPDGTPLRLDPWQEEISAVRLGAAEFVTTRYVDAFLDLERARLPIEAGRGEGICGNMQGRVDGTLTAAQVLGYAQSGEQNVTFNQEVMTLHGTFDFEDDNHTHPRPTRMGQGSDWVEASAAGNVRMVGVDFVPVATQPASGLDLDPKALGLLGLASLLALTLAKNWASLVAFLYSRLGPERILDNPVRRRVYEAVLQDPGRDLSQLAAHLDCPLTSLTYHVRILQRAGKIGTLRHGKSIRVLPREAMPVRPNQFPTFLLGKDPQLSFVADLLGPAPRRLPEVVSAVTERFGLSRRGALHVVDRGVQRGLFAKEASGEGKGGKAMVIRCAKQ